VDFRWQRRGEERQSGNVIGSGFRAVTMYSIESDLYTATWLLFYSAGDPHNEGDSRTDDDKLLMTRLMLVQVSRRDRFN